MNNLTLLPEEQLPQTDEPKKKKQQVNCLQDMILEFMNEFDLKDADMVKGTGIKWGTWYGWITADVDCQLADRNLFELWKFVNKYKKIPLEYLVYGVGTDGELIKEEIA